jgi:GTP pyrophosphokinase
LKEISEQELTRVAGEHGLGKPDDLLAGIGYGKFSARSILARVLPAEAAASVSGTATPEDERPGGIGSVVRRVFGGETSAIRVTGHDDLLVYRARCCNPIRGEEIIGYVTRGKGVAVHSKSCSNVNNLLYEADRRIAVEWGSDGKVGTVPVWQTGYPVKLVVYCDNRPGMLKQITAVISDADTNIRNIGATTAETHATVDIIIDIADLKHLERIVEGVRKIPGVRDVQRVQKLP